MNHQVESETPYGIQLTKRCTVPTAEGHLYFKHATHTPDEYVELIDYMGGDATVERVATAGHGRMIFPEKPNLKNFFSHLKLSSILMPFRSVQLKFRIQSSILDALHIVYDKRASVNEYSGRYSVMVDSSFLPRVDFLKEILDGKGDLNIDVAREARELVLKGREKNFQAYREHVSPSVDLARELARTPLELNNDTSFIWKIDLHSLVSFIQEKRQLLRGRKHTLHAYLDFFEILGGAVAPIATEALFSGKKVIALTYPSGDEIVDSTPRPPSWGASLTKRITVEKLEDVLFQRQPYLEHGFVQAVDYMGGDRGPVESARISYGKGTVRLQEDEKLTRYLYRHRHTTPFESLELAVEGKVPLFVDPRQAGRHRTLDDDCFMGEVFLGSDFFVPARDELKHQDRKNRQGRGNELDEELKDGVLSSFRERYHKQQELALKLREDGFPEHIITGVKGVGFYTFRWRSGDLKNWLHFLGLRLDSHAQKEIRSYAAIFADFLKRQAPTSVQALQDYQMDAISFSKKEIPMIATLIARNTALDIDELSLYRPLGFTMREKDKVSGVEKEKLNREGEELRGKLAHLLTHTRLLEENRSDEPQGTEKKSN